MPSPNSPSPQPEVPGIPSGVPYDIELHFINSFSLLLATTAMREYVAEQVTDFIKMLESVHKTRVSAESMEGANDRVFVLYHDVFGAAAPLRMISNVLVEKVGETILFKLGPPKIVKVGRS